MDTAENDTVAAELTEALPDPALTVLEEPMSLSTGHDEEELAELEAQGA